MEALWLLTVVLVPLAFLDKEYIYSEAEIAFIELPKIAILRTLVGLMTILWLLEWGIGGRFPLGSWFNRRQMQARPSTYLAPILGWLREQPSRWLIVAVWFFFFSTLVSTVFSASVKVSLWGEIPGQDGLSAYTLLSHILLFGVITAHLKTRAQLWRLMCAIAITGVLVSGFAVTQHYGTTFLGVSESSNLNGFRVTATMGNAVFAGAAMLIPISISFLLANISLQQLNSSKRFTGPLRLPLINLLAIATSAMVLAIQFMGLIFTFSRGPWLGTLLTLSGFLALSFLFVGWRGFGRAILILGWSALLSGVIILTTGSVLTSGIALGVWTLLIITTVITIAVAFQDSLPMASTGQRIEVWSSRLRLSGSIKARLVSGTIMAIGIIVAMALVFFVVMPPAGLISVASGEDNPETTSSDNLGFQITQRFASITNSILTGDLSNRVDIWSGSIVLMREHPWFEFDTLRLPWIRSLVGYGPDMFRYTYLLVSVPVDSGGHPAEPDHAHNFFLNQGVEQGLLGLLSSFGIFLAVFCVGSYQLIQRSKGFSDLHKLVLVGLVATVAGRFLEQTVGLTRVSDLMLFWVLLAAFAALPVAIQSQNPSAETIHHTDPNTIQPRRTRRGHGATKRNIMDMSTIIRLILVGWAVGGVFALTWVKTVNYPRAGIAASQAFEHVRLGDNQSALQLLNRASQLAPDVPIYHTRKSSVYASILNNPQLPQDPECSLELNGVPYQDCLIRKIHLNNILGTEQRPFYWRSKVPQANSALALGLEDEAIRLYRESIDLAPTSWALRNLLAEAYIDIGQPWEALVVLEESIAINRDYYTSDIAECWQGIALEKLELIREPAKMQDPNLATKC
jgi:hypothetical protein